MVSWPANTYKQGVTWWKKSGRDSFGASTYDIPVCFKGRWEKKQEIFIDSVGEETRSDSVVWTPCNVFIGDFIHLGASTNLDPKKVFGSREIRKVKRKSGWKNDQWTEIRALL